MNPIRRHRHGIGQRSGHIGTPHSVGAGSLRIVCPRLTLARGRTRIPSATRPSGRKFADVIDAPGSCGRTRRPSGSARQRVTLTLRVPTATKGVEQDGPSQRQDEAGERRDCCRRAPQLMPAYQNRCASGIAADEDLLGGALGSAGDAHPGTSDRADAGITAGPTISTTPASVRMPRPPTRQSDQAHSYEARKERTQRAKDEGVGEVHRGSRRGRRSWSRA